MSFISDVLFRLRAVFRRDTLERELDEELRFHLERDIARDMERGLPREEAERKAKLAFGGIEQVKEQSRDSRGVSALDNVFRDLRYGARVLRKSPAFTSVAVLSLALGIGANTALFQLLDALRLRSLPVNAPHELAQIEITDMSGARGSINREGAVTYGIWDQIQKRQQAFSGVFAWAGDSLNLSPAGEVRMAESLWVSGEFFRALGVNPALGRLLTPADDYRGCGTPGAVISYSFWQSEFGLDRSVIGRRLTLNGRPVEVVGVTARGFFGLEVGRAFQVALPVCSVPAVRGWNALDSGTFWWLTVMGRLRPGWTTERAAAHLNSISAGIFEASLPAGYPAISVAAYLGMKLAALPAAAGISGLRNAYSVPLGILLAIAGTVLLIACANLANLMLARGSAREREIAVRLAIGASRGRIIRQLLAESALISSAGAAAGLLASRVLSRALVSFLSSDEGSIHLDLNADWRVLGFTAGLALVTCLLFGLTPALRATRTGPVLRAASRGVTAGRETFGLRRLLVISQIALSMVLLVGALLFVRSLRNLHTVETGFRQEGILIADLRFARANPAEVHVLAFQKALLERLQSVPGVISVADTTIVPISGNARGNKTWMDGANPEQAVESLFSLVSPGYFRTLDVPLAAGRDFGEHDTPASAKVAIVNDAFARRIANAANPVGRRLRVEATPSTPETVYEIVGLVRNTKYRSLREGVEPVVYLPLSQDPAPNLGDQLLIRSNMQVANLLPPVRRAIAEVDPNARFAFREFKVLVGESLLRERLMATLSSAFGILAGLLSAIGLYGVISYMVARRRNEIGIRMALGADRGEIIATVLGESGRMLAIGLAAGAVLSICGASLARTLLFGLKPYDAGALATAMALLGLVAVCATYLPARRAAGVDPMTALGEE